MMSDIASEQPSVSGCVPGIERGQWKARVEKVLQVYPRVFRKLSRIMLRRARGAQRSALASAELQRSMRRDGDPIEYTGVE